MEQEQEWEEYWKPLLYTNKKLDIDKIKNEMMDLIFIYQQVAEVYCHITGGLLSKPNYYAKTIIDEYDNQINKAYEEGIKDKLNK